MNKAVVMAGGFGTRLRPLSMNIPKPMVPIANKPMMEHIVNLLKRNGIKDIVSLLYFQPEKITSYFEDGAKFSINMNYVSAKADYGTAGSVRNAKEFLDEPFIIISGDVLTDFDLKKAIRFHEEKKAKATLLLTRVTKPLQYGIVMTDDEGKVTRFLEKPSWGQVFSDTINTGIYILEPEVLDLIPYQEEFDFSKDLFPLMLEKGMPLYGYIADNYWRDIGNLNEYQSGQIDAINNKVDIMIDGMQNGTVYIGDNCNIAPTAKLFGNVVIGNNVTIGEHAQIVDSVIGDNSFVGAGTRIDATTVWNDTEIGDFCEISNDVICAHCKINDSVTISEYVYIADECHIGENAKINPNIKLWPGKRVEEGATLSRSLVQEEKWMKELFTDARISGLSNIDINPEFGAKLGTALGMIFGENASLLASRDPDKVSRIMKRSITAGISSVGTDVYDLQTMSIPQTRQELRTGRYEGGFHVRRSPRDMEKSDIIIFNKEGRDISIAKTKSIERFFFGEDVKRVQTDQVGQIRFPERTNEIYIERFIQSLDKESIKKNKYKVLMDYSFGLASTIFPSILGRIGVEALSLNDYVDVSRFHPDPELMPKNTDQTGKIMRSLGYEMGFRLEAGAEKISLIDERGIWYAPSRLLSIVTKLFLEANKEREPYSIAVSILAPQEIEMIAKDYNVEVFRIKDSHSAMMEATRADDVLFVGGSYGGYIFSDFLFAADGMFSVGYILEMLSKTAYKISDLDESLPRTFQQKVVLDCPWDSKGKVMRMAMKYSEDHKRELVEGVKIFLEEGNVLMLPSREKAAFNVVAETTEFETSVALAKKYSSIVKKWIEEN